MDTQRNTLGANQQNHAHKGPNPRSKLAPPAANMRPAEPKSGARCGPIAQSSGAMYGSKTGMSTANETKKHALQADPAGKEISVMLNGLILMQRPMGRLEPK